MHCFINNYYTVKPQTVLENRTGRGRTGANTHFRIYEGLLLRHVVREVGMQMKMGHKNASRVSQALIVNISVRLCCISMSAKQNNRA